MPVGGVNAEMTVTFLRMIIDHQQRQSLAKKQKKERKKERKRERKKKERKKEKKKERKKERKMRPWHTLYSAHSTYTTYSTRVHT